MKKRLSFTFEPFGSSHKPWNEIKKNKALARKPVSWYIPDDLILSLK